MDQEPLAREEIDAARKFLDDLDKRIPVRAAFWLKADEDSGWYLYVASDQVSSDRSVRPAYEEVGKVAATIDDPNFALFRVRLIGLDHPLAKAALDHYRRHPARIPTYLREERFGGMGVGGVYLYPPSVAALGK